MIFAEDIPSSVTEAECARLSDLAEGGRVLELGAWLGRSTIALASTATHVHSVDWHQGDDHVGSGDTAVAFLKNLNRYGVRNRVVAHFGQFEEVAPLLRDRLFAGAFIDGHHSTESVSRDYHLTRRLVARGGWFAFHDYGITRFGVTDVVNSLGVPEVVDTLAVVRA